MTRLLELNDYHLQQVTILLEGYSKEAYTMKCELVFSSSMGEHLRHCVEHYEEFLQATHEGRCLDYEARPRDLSVESDRNVALDRISRIRRALKEQSFIPPEGYSLRVLDTGADTPSLSSTERELQYLLSHTVHHFAMIAVIARSHGLAVPADFGIAPSTLKFRAAA
jgi:uncharacterized damage-inducible protein DinB